MYTLKEQFYLYADQVAPRLTEQTIACEVIEYCADQLASIGRTPLTDLDRRLINYIIVTQRRLEESGNKLSLGVEHEYDLLTDESNPKTQEKVNVVDPAGYETIGRNILAHNAFEHIGESINYDAGIPSSVEGPYGEARIKPSTPLASIAATYLTELAIAIETATSESYSAYRMVRKSSHIHYDVEPFTMFYEYKAVNRGILKISKRAIALLISDEEREHCLITNARPTMIEESTVWESKRSFIRPIIPQTNSRDHYEFRKAPRGEPEICYPLTAQTAVLLCGITYGLENPLLERESAVSIITSALPMGLKQNGYDVKFAHWVEQTNAHTMSHDPILCKQFGKDLLAEYRLSEMKKWKAGYSRW